MSSHHIVREKQEPALLVLGLDNFDDEQLGQLLEWSPTLITTPPVAEQLNAFGIKIDWIITGELNSDYLQSDIKHLPPGDDTLISAALNWLTDQGYPAVNIVTDELDLENYLPFADKINLVLFYNRQKIYAVNNGFNKWKPANESILLLSAATNLKTDGLEKTANNTFHTVADGFFTLKFDAPVLLFIAETL